MSDLSGLNEFQSHPRCPAVDYPVWSDGTQDVIQCRFIAGHEGDHRGHIGSYGITWTFSSDGNDGRAS